MKHLQGYMTNLELDHIQFKRMPQKHQFPTTLHFKIEEVFLTLDTYDVYMSTDHSMIDPIVNRNFGNTFHHQNGPNQCQYVHKNTSQQYQYRSYQIPKTLSIPYLNEY